MSRPTVVIVDDHDIVRAGAVTYLDADFDIVGEAGDVAEAIEVISEHDPDVVLIDVHLPSGSGADVVKAVRERGGDCRFLALSVSAARSDVVAMLDAGVNGYLLKSTMGAELPALVTDMIDGGKPLSPQVAGFMLDIDEDIDEVHDDDGLERLTKREREVVELIARGYTYKATSDALFVSPKTIEAHMHNIFEKLGVASRHELSVRALRSGWMNGDDI